MNLHHTLRLLFCMLVLLFAQVFTPIKAGGWTADLHNPGDLIENQGQYSALFSGFGGNVRYVIDYGFGWQAGLGDAGAKILIRTVEKSREREENGPEIKNQTIHTQQITAEWIGLGATAKWEAVNPSPAYYTYSDEVKGETRNFDAVPAYGEVWLRDAWQGIDILYQSPKAGGLKYSIYLEPGADLSKVKLKYGGGMVSLDQDGNLRLPTLLGDLVDYAPIAHYGDGNQEPISVRFALNNNIVHFETGAYDPARPLVIDPWTVNPALPAPFNRAFEVDFDNAGNVYVFGGGMGYQLKKYNAAGTLQWTHVSPWDTSNGWFGELLTLGTGESFITSGSAAKIRRVTTAGSTTFTNNGPFFNLDEYWTLVLNCDKTRLISGGSRIVGFTSPQGHIYNLNMGSGGQLAGSPYNVAPSFMNEVRALATGSNGNLYMLSNNDLIAMNQTFGIIYSVSSGYAYPYYSPQFMAKNVQGQNSIDADNNSIYTMNGPNVHRRAIGTGAINATAAVPGGSATGGFGGSGAANSGLRIDNCSNVYVGSTNAVHKYNSALTLLTSVSTSGPVYDVEVAPGGVVLIGGAAFVTSNTSLAACAIKTVSCIVLDAELASFQAECRDGNIWVEWTSATEKNLERYELERSTDGMAWEVLSSQTAGGQAEDYHFREAGSDLSVPVVYYRLKMTDREGQVDYSGVQSVEICQPGENALSIYPTKTMDFATLTFESAKAGTAEMMVFAADGRRVMHETLSMIPGNNEIRINLSRLESGMYFVKVAGFDQAVKVVRE